MKILKPPKLNKGDTIGIVAGSLPLLPSFRKNYERGKKIIEEMGFKIKEGKTIGKNGLSPKVKWWMSGEPKEVAEDINNMFADKNIKAIFTQTGGHSAIYVLEHLDYELIRKNPKPFIGMSDMTVYHLALLTKCNLIGFHMDDVTFGLGRELKMGQENWLKMDKEFFLKFLTKTKAPGIIKPLSEWEVWRKGKAEGRLIGGILERISTQIGTPYFPPIEMFDKNIFFWEEVGESLTYIAQYLYQLKYLGVLDKISGMLIGKIKYLKPVRDKEVIEPTVKEMILDILKEYDFPIMSNLDFGHFTVNIPMPIGIKVSFDTSKKELNFLEGAVV